MKKYSYIIFILFPYFSFCQTENLEIYFIANPFKPNRMIGNSVADIQIADISVKSTSDSDEEVNLKFKVRARSIGEIDINIGIFKEQNLKRSREFDLNHRPVVSQKDTLTILCKNDLTEYVEISYVIKRKKGEGFCCFQFDLYKYYPSYFNYISKEKRLLHVFMQLKCFIDSNGCVSNQKNIVYQFDRNKLKSMRNCSQSFYKNLH